MKKNYDVSIKTEKELRRFLKKIEFSKDCWEWKAAKGKGDYGMFGLRGKTVLAHRVAYELFKGPIQDETIDHLCGNRTCMNPEHLDSCSLSENRKRAIDKTGRVFSEGRYAEGYYKTNEYQREWKAANREHINAYAREWREANRERVNAYNRKWRAKQKELRADDY